MSVIVKGKDDISKSPLNNSSSKQMFSFSKADRFDKNAKNNSSSTYFYNLPDIKSKRAASIGKGNKYDFTRDNKGKNNQFYNAGSDFDQKNPYSPKWSFGLGREFFGKVYYETNKMLDKDVPGPGKYDYLKKFGSEAYKFSLRGKSEEKGLGKKNIVPGPGEYSALSIQINKEGKYPVSNFRNATKIIFGANKGERFNYSHNKYPGPQSYKIDPLINGNGKIFVSKFKSSPGKTISGRYDLKDRNSVPGPGAYNYFSEWGMYESKNTQEHMNNSLNKIKEESI